jgi:hypothetical protein
MSSESSAGGGSVPDPFRPRFDEIRPGNGYDCIEAMSHLRQAVDSMPATRSTFKVDVVPSGASNNVRPWMILLVGSWEMPNIYPGSSDSDGRTRYINPYGAHAHKYPDVFVECECGAFLVRQKQHSNADKRVEGEHEHADCCKRSWRLDARSRLMEKREEAVRSIVGYGLAPRAFAERFGLDPTGYEHSIGSLVEAQHIPTDALREEARERRTNTECFLLAAGYSTSTVGDVWGVEASTIRGRVANRTPWDVDELKSWGLEP